MRQSHSVSFYKFLARSKGLQKFLPAEQTEVHSEKPAEHQPYKNQQRGCREQPTEKACEERGISTVAGVDDISCYKSEDCKERNETEGVNAGLEGGKAHYPWRGSEKLQQHLSDFGNTSPDFYRSDEKQSALLDQKTYQPEEDDDHHQNHARKAPRVLEKLPAS